jgi:hypothetical protein
MNADPCRGSGSCRALIPNQQKKIFRFKDVFQFLGEQRAAERSGAPAHQAQDQTAGPREQGFLSGQAFHIYLFTVIEEVCVTRGDIKVGTSSTCLSDTVQYKVLQIRNGLFRILILLCRHF